MDLLFTYQMLPIKHKQFSCARMLKFLEVVGLLCHADHADGCGMFRPGCGMFVLELTQKWQRGSEAQFADGSSKPMRLAMRHDATGDCGTVPEANAKDCFIGDTCAVWKGFLHWQSHYTDYHRLP